MIAWDRYAPAQNSQIINEQKCQNVEDILDCGGTVYMTDNMGKYLSKLVMIDGVYTELPMTNDDKNTIVNWLFDRMNHVDALINSNECSSCVLD